PLAYLRGLLLYGRCAGVTAAETRSPAKVAARETHRPSYTRNEPRPASSLRTHMADKTNDSPSTAVESTKFGSKRLSRLYSDLLQSEKYIADFVGEWQTNVDYRRNRPLAAASEVDCTAVPWDWTMTKSKQTQLFSQVPQVRLKARHPRFSPGLPIFQRKVNDLVCRAEVGVAMYEVVPDIVNATGAGAVLVAFESRSQERSVPVKDPLLAQLEQSQAGAQPPAAPAEAAETMPDMEAPAEDTA